MSDKTMKRPNWNFVPGTDGWFSRPMHCCYWIAAQCFLLLWGDWSAFVFLFFLGSVFDVTVSLWGIMGWDGVHFGWWLTRSLKEVEAGTLALVVWWLMRPTVLFLVVGMHLNCFLFLQFLKKCLSWNKSF